MDGTFIDPTTAGGWGEAEQPERADYGNASTDRLKECAFEAQERSNKSSVLPLLAVKCLGFHSMTKSETCAEYQAAAVDKHIRVASFHVNKHIKSLSMEQTPRRSPPTSALLLVRIAAGLGSAHSDPRGSGHHQEAGPIKTTRSNIKMSSMLK